MNEREIIAELREENDRLRGILAGLNEYQWRGIKLPYTKKFLLALLSSGKLYSTTMLLDALQAEFFREDDRDPQAVWVYIFRIREALSALDPPIRITNYWGIGYQIDAENLALLNERRIL